ncbi:MAG: catabolite control protein A [Limosilactobacillus pontis]|uniref:Catabolite control protein A n=1 Tax=Limosilactobacillus pontis TaxID=35787 RepID=A0A2J6NLJ8_9LACO|nr:catabolite control protein A [Limosilactobacillus pontis]PMB82199.1 catabolite control protein A [Limosilactobacillus pontis]
MEKQSVTIYTVAREARVSMATVSRVVNGNPNVKPATRQKVMDVIKRLNYRPNAVARGLASKKTTTVGVVIPRITDPYFADLALGIDDIASMYKYNIILTNSDNDDDKVLKVVRNLLAKQVDGIIFMGFNMPDELKEELKSSNTPVVVAGSVVNDDDLATVRIDYQNAAKEATLKLLDNAKDNVAFVTSSLKYTINGQARLSGYQAALQERQVAFDDQLVVETDGTYQSSYDQAKKLVAAGIKGAYVSDDKLAVGLLNGLTDNGVKVPEEFEIISSNDTNYTKISRPTISSITQPTYDIGAIAMRLLTKLMDSNESTTDEKDVILDHGFAKRQSTR